MNEMEMCYIMMCLHDIDKYDIVSPNSFPHPSATPILLFSPLLSSSSKLPPHLPSSFLLPFILLLLVADNPFLSTKRTVGRLSSSVLKAAGERDIDKGKGQAGESGKEKETNVFLKNKNPFLKQAAAGDGTRGVVRPKESNDEYDDDVVEF